MNADPFASRLDILLDRLAGRRHRALLWVSGAPSEAMPRALRLWRARPWQAPLWLGPSSPAPDVVALPAAKARTRLGGEQDLVVIDAVSPGAGFDPDAFGAVAGTLRAGGLLVLLTPTEWHTGTPLPDADYARLAAWPFTPAQLSARYLARLAHHLSISPLVLAWPAGQGFPDPDPDAARPAPGASERIDDPDCLSADQAQAVARLTKLRRRRPLVLSADRGRGKSAALGIAAARRLLAGEERLWLTAPRLAAVAPVFERLAALLPEGRHEANRFTVTVAGEQAEVRFVAPDALIETLQEQADPHSPPTLFVDEAAAIPAALLGRWLEAFPRIAYATTVHGYEGTGRGFQLRFRTRLDRDTPDWRELHLHQPVRWAEGDPLETLTRELLLLDAEPASETRVARALETQSLRLTAVDRTVLAGDDASLSQLFGLLVQAHYRTTPADLRQLLDAPGLQLLAAWAGDVCLGVCLAQAEGGFPGELAGAIQRGERRPRGHLLAQSLATHAGHRAAAEARWWRVLRIAVHPAARRQGIGRALIDELAERADREGVAHLGVSFGTDVELIAFWRSLGFVSLRLGLTREAASGEHALMMGRALDDTAAPLIDDLSGDFQALLPSLLAFELKRLDSELAATLLREGSPPIIDDYCLKRLAWFAEGGGELALARPWLARAWLAWWRRGGHGERQQELMALVAPLFQGEDIRPGQKSQDGQGRKARMARWRALAGMLHRELAATVEPGRMGIEEG